MSMAALSGGQLALRKNPEDVCVCVMTLVSPKPAKLENESGAFACVVRLVSY